MSPLVGFTLATLNKFKHPWLERDRDLWSGFSQAVGWQACYFPFSFSTQILSWLSGSCGTLYLPPLFPSQRGGGDNPLLFWHPCLQLIRFRKIWDFLCSLKKCVFYLFKICLHNWKNNMKSKNNIRHIYDTPKPSLVIVSLLFLLVLHVRNSWKKGIKAKYSFVMQVSYRSVARAGDMGVRSVSIGPKSFVILTKILTKLWSGEYSQCFRTLNTPSLSHFWLCPWYLIHFFTSNCCSLLGKQTF